MIYQIHPNARAVCTLRIGDFGPQCTNLAVEECSGCSQRRCEEHAPVGYINGRHDHGGRSINDNLFPKWAPA